MSNTPPTPNTRALQAVPDAAPLTGLTGTPAAIYTQLAGLTEAATVAELALAAGVSRSGAGKALVTLEEHGLAVRTPGGHDGPRRTPDRWSPAPTRPANLTSANDRANEADSKAMTVPADTTSNSVSTTPAPDDSSAPPNTEAPGTTADGAPAGPGT
ncbi:helix-turn-helix domain-containing protein, partial [Streptomyces sp. T-3]|nr:helix-turn-helix domain-containing protein [Streptomyces sp. T-3]